MKNIFTLLKDIWNGNFCKHPKEIIAQSQQPKQELQIGCLALGLVKSFKTEPDSWVRVYNEFEEFRNRDKNAMLVFYCDHVSLNGSPIFTKEESIYISREFKRIEEENRIKKIERHKEYIRKEMKYFVDLGCPKR